MAHIYLIRHGEVEGNSGLRRTFVGWGDKPLTARGEAQAQAVAERLQNKNLQAVYASDLQRSCRTAEYIARPHGVTVQCDAALREINFGAWEGLSEAEILADWQKEWQRRQSDPVQVGAPDGESLNDLWARWQPTWQRIVHEHQGQTVAIVSHNSALRVLLCHLLDAPFSSYRRINMSNCGLTRVEIKAEAAAGTQPPIMVHYINETGHLKDI
ncbi:MAG: histidine phosphatase family protein [Abitibacteriaceae bacterium]|nr:histidine phosphatase family protein [Abditibacteriaceae bacterium]MBV9868385.1 histidine phosphatase family protein [Abditibacteriaceae bacterium]